MHETREVSNESEMREIIGRAVDIAMVKARDQITRWGVLVPMQGIGIVDDESLYQEQRGQL